MSNLKGTSRVMVVAILIAACVFMISNMAAGKDIGYPAIRSGDGPHGCDPKHPETCHPPQPVNPYKPGCPPSARCRGGPPGRPIISM
ncbi:unnamed protein product [Eruca vesicaria subsp. sativa]|uniref:Uncharacterized protein n=1 Tax=Eruca vesicaria subsp. sativa TaxID=29727 RepID=A0ABC8J673_ERUVS|nr:unnamed protein product [Eruca vesicaria subsp. sativa]